MTSQKQMREYSNCWSLEVGGCGDCWKPQRVASNVHDMTENASILIVFFPTQLQQTETSDKKLAIFQSVIMMSPWVNINIRYEYFLNDRAAWEMVIVGNCFTLK